MTVKKESVDSKIIDKIDMSKLPKHIAIIMDGNGRWAKKRFLPRSAGHKAGVERVKEIVKAAGDLGIKHLTLYAFSTENWNRPNEEIEYLMKLLVEYLRKELETLHNNSVKIRVLGDLNRLSAVVKDEIFAAIKKTKNNNKLTLNIALNYGGRDEIIRGIRLCIEDVIDKKIDLESINEEAFKEYLFTQRQPDPDILIRTSGENRLSNFLLYQVAYTEFWYTDIYWPEFKKEFLYKAIVDYQKRERRFGGI